MLPTALQLPLSSTVLSSLVVPSLFNGTGKSTLFPPGRPTQLIVDGYYWGKPVGFIGGAKAAAQAARVGTGKGMYLPTDVDSLVEDLKDGLATFKFTDRFPLDN